MADLSSRPYVHSKDQERIIDLLLAYRLATSIYTYPTIWRSLLLLTSRVGEPAYDTRLWEDTAGRVVGLAMLWRRYPKDPYLVLERFVHPDFVTDELAKVLLAWGIQRAHQVAAAQATPLTLYTNRIGPAIHPDSHLEVCGFKPTTPDPQAYNVYFTRSLQATLPTPMLPVGYTLRSLQGIAELEKYNTLYGFATVNLQHRQELLTSDEYSHLIVEDSSGTFIAYCECSICRAEWQPGNQKMGWIDYIGVNPEKRQQGLGRAILLASLHRLQAWGTETVRLITVSTNTPALKLYEATGFTPVTIPETLNYERNITPGKL